MRHDSLLAQHAPSTPCARHASRPATAELAAHAATASHAVSDSSAATAAPGDPCTPLERLCARIDAAFAEFPERADPSRHPTFARRLRAALAEAATSRNLLTRAQCEGDPHSYRRHLLAADPRGRYAVVALVWGPGQASPVHAHHAWCGYAVVDGELSEIVYDWNDTAGCAIETRHHARPAGAVSYVKAGATGIHRLGLDAGTGRPRAVSLHVYGVDGDHIANVNDVVAAAPRV